MQKAFLSTLIFAAPHASLLSKSSIESCLQTDEALNCQQKLVLLVDLAQDQNLDDEAYIFSIKETDDL
jgi:hypothetical protein